MDSNTLNFLTQLLGTEGAKALARSANKQPLLGQLLVPRTALSWVQRQGDYEGTVPGIPNSYLKFAKSENLFSGLVTLDTLSYEFEDVAPEHVAAALSVSVGSMVSGSNPIGNVTLQRLGKSIDILVGAQFVALKLVKSITKEESSETEKAEVAEHGATAKPFKQKEPEGPIPPGKQVGGITSVASKPKLPKLPAMKVEKSEMEHECPACGGKQFKENRFRGCTCLRDLAKHVKSTIYGDGAVLEFKPGFEPEAYKILRKSLKSP